MSGGEKIVDVDEEILLLLSRLATETHVTRAIAQTVEGRFAFDLRDHVVGMYLARDGDWEPVETAIAKRLLRAGDLVIDAGANLGWYSVVFGRAVGPTGVVLAFEPDTRNFDLLTTNLALNGIAGPVVTHQAALFEREGTIELEEATTNFGDHRIRTGRADPSSAAYFGENERVTHEVRARSIDAVLAERGLDRVPIRLLKMDTQGAEVAILRGASAALGRTEHVLSEYWPYGLERAGYAVDEYLAAIEANFAWFVRVQWNRFEYRPIAEFRADAASVPAFLAPGIPGFVDYLFSKARD